MNIKQKNISLDILRQRNRTNLEKFVWNHFRERTHFINAKWSEYNFLNNNINYTQETHNHGSGDFDFSANGISHIETICAEIKKVFYKI